jgi:hypothetical protein
MTGSSRPWGTVPEWAAQGRNAAPRSAAMGTRAIASVRPLAPHPTDWTSEGKPADDEMQPC